MVGIGKQAGTEARQNKNEEKGRSRSPLKMIFTIILILAGGIGIVLSNAVIYDTQVETNQLRRELAAQRENNAAVRTEITQRYTLNEVERIAKEKLDMNKPDASQIIYINVPKQSHVVLNDEDGFEETGYNLISSITELVRDTVKRFTGK